MDETVDEMGPAAAYSAKVAAWLQQAYQAQMVQYGFQSFLAYQAMSGRFPSQQQQQQQSPPRQQQNINVNLNIPGVGNVNVPGVGINLNVNNNNNTVPVLRATLVPVSL